MENAAGGEGTTARTSGLRLWKDPFSLRRSYSGLSPQWYETLRLTVFEIIAQLRNFGQRRDFLMTYLAKFSKHVASSGAALSTRLMGALLRFRASSNMLTTWQNLPRSGAILNTTTWHHDGYDNNNYRKRKSSKFLGEQKRQLWENWRWWWGAISEWKRCIT